MSYKQVLEGFHQQIRRNKLEEIFKNKRIKLLEGQKQQVEKMEKQQVEKMEEEQDVQLVPNNLNLDDLKTFSNQSQNQRGLVILEKRHIRESMIKYLTDEYIGKKEQQYATFIICNLSYITNQKPTKMLLDLQINLLQEGDSQVVENVLSYLDNIMIDHQDVKNILIDEGLVDNLNRLFSRFPQPKIRYIGALVTCIFRVVHQSQPRNQFLKFRQKLIRILFLTPENQNIETIRKAVYSLYLITQMYPKETSEDFIIKGKVIEKLIDLVPKIQMKRYINIILGFVEIVMPVISETFVQSVFLPFISQLMEENFEIGQQSSIYTARTLRIFSFNLINAALEMGKLSPEKFIHSEIFNTVLEQFLTSEDSDILVSLIYVFTQVYLNTENEKLKFQIEKGILRVKLKNSDNFELMAFIQQVQANFPQ